MLLAGDIGASKSNLGVFSPEAGPRAPIAEATFASTDFASLEALCLRFLEESDHPVHRASLGVPGPVANGRAREPAWLRSELAKAEDRTPIILGAAQDPTRDCELCRKTLELFVSILGAKAGNLALITLATGGVYIGGGIAPRLLSELSDGTFAAAFESKGRLRPLLERIPVHVIRNPKASIIGAAAHGLALASR